MTETKAQRPDQAKGAPGGPSRWARSRPRIPGVLVWYCRVVGIVSFAGALSRGFQDWVVNLPDWAYYTVGFLFGVPSLGYGVLMLMLGTALRRRKRAAWWTLLVQILLVGPIGWVVVSALFDHLKWSDVTSLPLIILGSVAVQVLLLALLLTSRREFYARQDAANVRLALVVLAVAFALSAVIGFTLVASQDRGSASGADHLLYTVKAGMAGTGLWWYDTAVDVPHWVDVTVNFLGSLMIIAVAYALFMPRRGQVRHLAEDDGRLRALLEKHGEQDSLGYFAMRQDKAVMWSPSGKAAIAYRPVGGVSLAAGDPIGDPEAWPGAIDAWLEEAREHAWVPAVMGASEEGGRVLARHGLDAIELGDEAVVEVDDFTLEGRPMRVVRQAYNRVGRAGYTTRIRRHGDIPAAEMAGLVALADTWRDGAVERGFSMALGRLGDPADTQCVMVECFDGDGVPKALLSFVPWGRTGLSLDLMRRDRDSENGLVEFMVIELLQASKDPAGELGVERVSLNFAMFRSVFDRAQRLGAGPFLRATRAVLVLFSKWWQLESLYRANVKYRPVWEPRYLCFPQARDLPRISIAAGRAEGFIALPSPKFLRRNRAPKLQARPEQTPSQTRTQTEPPSQDG